MTGTAVHYTIFHICSLCITVATWMVSAFLRTRRSLSCSYFTIRYAYETRSVYIEIRTPISSWPQGMSSNCSLQKHIRCYHNVFIVFTQYTAEFNEVHRRIFTKDTNFVYRDWIKMRTYDATNCWPHSCVSLNEYKYNIKLTWNFQLSIQKLDADVFHRYYYWQIFGAGRTTNTHNT